MWWVDNVNNRLKQALQLSCCCWSLLGIQSNTQAQLSIENNTNFFLDSPESTKYAVIMAGPSAGEQNQTRFRQWAFSLHDILARDYGYSSDTITLLLDRGEQDSPGGERIDGACDRNGIEQGLATLKARVETGDQITLYLIGHGSGAEEEGDFAKRVHGDMHTTAEDSSTRGQSSSKDYVRELTYRRVGESCFQVVFCERDE